MTEQTVDVVRQHVLIPLRDGVELSASVLRPDGLDRSPAIVSFTPYRADDMAGAAREPHRLRFARAGYHELLVDLRGTGSSSGQPWDGAWDSLEEGRDAADAVEWIAQQPWCDGNVGVWGLSYGAITLFNLAMHRPIGLRAGVAVHGSANIYRDFLFPGGIPNAAGNSLREALMLAMDLAPPSLRDQAGRWRRTWSEHLDRLADGRIWSFQWLEHPDYDDYWQRRTADCSRIETPLFLIGGWHDIFPEATVSAYEQLPGEKRLVIGPWPHVMPDYDPVHPWDWQQEALGWFDRWLGRGGGPLESDVAPVRLFVSGRDEWIGLPTADHGREERILYLASCGSLVAHAPEAAHDEHVGDVTVGSEGELYDPMGLGIGLAPRQLSDPHASLVFLSEPIDGPLDLIGAPHLTVHVELLEGEDLDLVAKLLDVRASGEMLLVTSGWLAARHRTGHDAPQPVEPGVVLPYEIELWSAARRIEQGSRVGLAVAVADFPRVFPPRSAPRIRIHHGGETASRLRLPSASGGIPIEMTPPLARRAASASPPRRVVSRDPATGRVTTSYGTSFGATCEGVEMVVSFEIAAAVDPRSPTAARTSSVARLAIDHPDGSSVVAEARRTSTRDHVDLAGSVSLDGVECFRGAWASDGRPCA
jgi:putative CocE/NonD family hydrolase